VVRAKWLRSPERQLLARGTEAMISARLLRRRWRTQSLFRQRVETVSSPRSGLPFLYVGEISEGPIIGAHGQGC
jgi:hypothetical protein